MLINKKKRWLRRAIIITGILGFGSFISGMVLMLSFINNLNQNVLFSITDNNSQQTSTSNNSGTKYKIYYSIDLGYGRENSLEIKKIKQLKFDTNPDNKTILVNGDLSPKEQNEKIYNFNNYYNFLCYGNESNKFSKLLSESNNKLIDLKNKLKTLQKENSKNTSEIDTNLTKIAANKNNAGLVTQLEQKNNELSNAVFENNVEIDALNSQIDLYNNVKSVNIRYFVSFPLIIFGVFNIIAFVFVLIYYILMIKQIKQVFLEDNDLRIKIK